MGQEGINYFVTGLGINTGNLRVFYNFVSGENNNINSIFLGKPLHTGQVNNNGNFFDVSGSGS